MNILLVYKICVIVKFILLMNTNGFIVLSTRLDVDGDRVFASRQVGT